ncbi:mitofilin family membrane protein [Nisaea sp.]|uniref:COG4223 family protein n=1 Tax=Nisaea sp. TaxID=2024842 RepID=UPI0032EF151D
MTDPKSQTGETVDKKASDGAEDVTVIEVEPTRTAEDAGEHAAASRGLSLRTKLIGGLILVVLVAGGVSAALYPLWRDRAEALVATSGLPLSMPEVPENAFYGTVDDVVSFLKGAAPEPTPAPVDKVEAPTDVVSAPEPVADPLTLLAERLDGLETEIGRLAQAARDAQSAADNATEKASALEAGIAAASAPDAEAVAALSAQLQRLENRLDALEARPVATAAESGSQAAAVNEALLNLIGSLRERIVSLESREVVGPSDLATVTSRVETSENTGQERLAALQAELEKVRLLAEKRAPQRERAGLLLLSVGQLEAVTVTSGSFAAQLASVKDLAAGDDPAVADALSVLETHAGGVETRASLAERFDDLAKAVSQAKLAGTDQGLIGKTLNTVASLVTIRRTDVAEGPGVDAILVRAETAVESGDISGAVTALEDLSGAPAERAASWIESAKARLSVDQAVRFLRGAALASVAEAG